MTLKREAVEPLFKSVEIHIIFYSLHAGPEPARFLDFHRSVMQFI